MVVSITTIINNTVLMMLALLIAAADADDDANGDHEDVRWLVVLVVAMSNSMSSIVFGYQVGVSVLGEQGR